MAMKKQLAVAVACLAMVSLQARADTVYQVTAANLFEHDGVTLLPQDRLVAMVIDTGNDGLSTATLSGGIALTNGASIGNDLIVGLYDLSAGGNDGQMAAQPLDVLYPPGVAGKRLGMYWFTGSTLANQQTVGGSWYGSFQDTTGGQDGSAAWVLPSDPGGNLDLKMLTTDVGGFWDPSTGTAFWAVVPEPSTVVLVAMGVLGMLAIRRRS